MESKRPALRVLNDALVPDARKGEVRRGLKRLRGQVDGLERMLDANRPCVEILTQLAAAQQALRGVESSWSGTTSRSAPPKALRSGREEEVYDELMEIVFKLTR